MKRIVFAVCAVLFVLGSANATVISYDLDIEFSGATAPAGSGPWLTASFDDGGSAGSVMLTLESNLLEPASFFGGVYFNFDLNQEASILTVGAGTDTGWSSFSSDSDCCQADGSGLYDAWIGFDANVFGGTDIFQFELMGAGITAGMFEYLNTPVGGSGVYHVAAHVQGLGPNGEDSGWIGDTPNNVPESATLLLMGLALLGLGVVRHPGKICT